MASTLWFGFLFSLIIAIHRKDTGFVGCRCEEYSLKGKTLAINLNLTRDITKVEHMQAIYRAVCVIYSCIYGTL